MSKNLILAFDTASENIALAVGSAGVQETGLGSAAPSPVPTPVLIASDDHPAVRQANVQLLPSIEALFATNNLARHDIAAVVCGLGPGSFTGVRIGVATAKGVALGLGVPLYGVSTLDAVAWGAWQAGVRGALGVVADAMRGEVYPARFDVDETGVHRRDSHTVAKADAVAQRWQEAGEPLLLLGDGLHKFANAFVGEQVCADLQSNAFLGAPLFSLAPVALWTPTGHGLLLAYQAAINADALGSGDPGAVLPIYTRLSDAEENERIRLASTGQVAQGAVVDVPRSGVAHPATLEAVFARPLAVGDLEQAAALEAQNFTSEKWTQGMLADDLQRSDRSWWVAYAGDQLAGFAGGWVVDGTLQVLDVVVAPQFRRRGIAHMLLGHLTRDGAALGATGITLEVRASNTAAQTLYTTLGLKLLGRRPGYYAPATVGAPREDALIMSGDIMLCARDKAPRFMSRPPDSQQDAGVQVPCHAAHPRILAIETSCDETAAALIDGDGRLLANVVASQVDFHARFGGVVPEIASRKHTEAIVGVIEQAREDAARPPDSFVDSAGSSPGSRATCNAFASAPLAWQELDALAVTYAPGLIGALVVGVAFAKGLSWATGLPLIRVNHLEGHIYANKFAESSSAPIAPPFIIALLSGGHTMLVHVKDWGAYEVLGQTLDDAVGEAFDKVAKALGLGYPGGPVIARLAEQGNPEAVAFPRAMLHSHDLRFSLSGLKTAVITYIRQETAAGRQLNLPDVAASFQQAVIDVQVAKALTALEQTGTATFCLGGGVAANKALRDAYAQTLQQRGIRVVFPPAIACTDNAAMIASVALDRFKRGTFMTLANDAHAHSDLEQSY
ncbi:MAG: tRNA (adenosine(37)-N6)-threonylcarbamoyltransferase complex transferase subunit TsaD [Coriobacteriales bacterium]|jgi:N6-L-threonylcarbamoyladenine synthase|nr:tRNA (adenosine(37)-N6)-threonylcarbamoyltransferase complex transferase subunit TsaD [Coriobacteriales bacterium]